MKTKKNPIIAIMLVILLLGSGLVYAEEEEVMKKKVTPSTTVIKKSGIFGTDYVVKGTGTSQLTLTQEEITNIQRLARDNTLSLSEGEKGQQILRFRDTKDNLYELGYKPIPLMKSKILDQNVDFKYNNYVMRGTKRQHINDVLDSGIKEVTPMDEGGIKLTLDKSVYLLENGKYTANPYSGDLNVDLVRDEKLIPITVPQSIEFDGDRNLKSVNIVQEEKRKTESNQAVYSAANKLVNAILGPWIQEQVSAYCESQATGSTG